ncbi:MAG TPA: kelch repeat-containing protein [bacterium]|nr:kelch repeat-containing protein [bacterium]HPN45989.1 kelch repeat-containing protein [bacterium]
MNRTLHYVFTCLFVAVLLFPTVESQAQQLEAPKDFYAFSTSYLKEGDDHVAIMIGGFKAKQYSFTDEYGVVHYEYFDIDRSNEIWKYKYRTHEWVQLKPYDESWLKVPPMAGHQAIQNQKDGYIYCFGGRSANGDSSVYMLNMQKREWRQLCFHKFYNHEKTAAAADLRASANPDLLPTGKAVFHGGIHDGIVSNELYEVTFTEDGIDIQSKTTPRALYGHSAIYDNSADVWHFWGGKTENGFNYENFTYSSAAGFGWGPQIQGPFVMPREGGATLLLDNSLYVWGGRSYSPLRKSAGDGEEIRTDLCVITAKDGQLYSKILATNLPPVSEVPLSVDIVDGDTLFYVFGGISTIWTDGDTSISNNVYRYNMTKSIIQQYDTTTSQWGDPQTSVDEEHFPVSHELQLDVPVWPNPAAGVVSYQLQEGIKAKSVKIYNQLGQMVLHINNPHDNRFDLNGYAPGIYFVRVDTNTRPCFARIVKISQR